MNIYCTTCSRKKLQSKKPIRAIDLYLSENIKKVYAKSLIDIVEFRILSGKFGLLRPDDKIRTYDYLLREDGVDSLKGKLRIQIKSQGIDNVTFFAEDRKTHPNWGPYYDAITESCKELGVGLELVVISG